MKIALCPTLSRDLDFAGNLERMAAQAEKAAACGAALALFGEAYLHGFEAMIFDYQVDIPHASAVSSEEIARVRELARKLGIAIGFGFFENDNGGIYSSYLVLDRQGETADLYRRVSTGWKEKRAFTCPDYREGRDFHRFTLEGKNFATMICGDFWEDDLLSEIAELDPAVDAFLWPVHCDFDPEVWTGGEREAYARRSAILAAPVCFVNNLREGEGRARGGAYVWRQGRTLAALEMGAEGILFYDLP